MPTKYTRPCSWRDHYGRPSIDALGIINSSGDPLVARGVERKAVGPSVRSAIGRREDVFTRKNCGGIGTRKDYEAIENFVRLTVDRYIHSNSKWRTDGRGGGCYEIKNRVRARATECHGYHNDRGQRAEPQGRQHSDRV